ncbi:MAG: hypothetical protein JWO72_303 [Caulobacteraceae bacterium]|nr:hypothetical protein [Caulobacteraceae bacterium]
MGWIVAAFGADSDDLPAGAVQGFQRIAASFPAAPWKIESGHLRSGRDRLEQLTGRSWAEVDMTAEAVKADYDALAANAALAERGGLTGALIAFLEVCARHNLGLEGGEGARAMRPTPKIQRPF